MKIIPRKEFSGNSKYLNRDTTFSQHNTKNKLCKNVYLFPIIIKMVKSESLLRLKYSVHQMNNT
jgi:hypothetical protein